MNISPESKVGQVAAEHPLATRVFARHGIDFCCGGGKPLGEVCTQRGLDTATVLAEIESELATPSATEVRWDQAPLGDLVEHILDIAFVDAPTLKIFAVSFMGQVAAGTGDPACLGNRIGKIQVLEAVQGVVMDEVPDRRLAG